LVALAPRASGAPDEDASRGEHEEDEEEEAFGEEWLWIDARAGYQHLDMVTFAVDEQLLTAGLLPTSVGGPALDFGLGARLWFITIGPRMRVAIFDAGPPHQGRFNLWSLDGEIGFRIPLGRVEPHLTLAAGYSGFGGIDDIVSELDSSYDIHGANVRAGAGLDVYITPNVSVGADVSGEVLILSRPGVPLDRVVTAEDVDTLNDAEAELLEVDGSSTGTAVTGLAGVGFHF
jgi:hypothetical protein